MSRVAQGGQRAQVAIVGAGPAGLVLANVLTAAGIDVCVVERQSRVWVEERARAGLIEHRVVEYLRAHGLADRLITEGTEHAWCDMVWQGERHRVQYGSAGERHWVYPQQFLVRDLLAELDKADATPLFESAVERIEGESCAHGSAILRGSDFTVEADYVLGCDGALGVVSQHFPSDSGSNADRRYPYDWLTVYADVTGPVEGIRYAIHTRGFAGMMPRAGNLARLYLEVPQDEPIENWPEERIRSELDARLGVDEHRPDIVRIRDSSMLRMRSGVRQRFRSGSAFLVGDAAHTVTPSGAKGLNLAIGDAADLAESLVRLYRDGDRSTLDGYSDRRRRIAQENLAFSEWLLDLLHLPPGCAYPAAELASRGATVRALAGAGEQALWFARSYVGAGALPQDLPVAIRG